MADLPTRGDVDWLNLKDLQSVLAASGGAACSWFAGKMEHGAAYLLIPKVLLASWLRKSL
jgi:hypothetical protein